MRHAANILFVSMVAAAAIMSAHAETQTIQATTAMSNLKKTLIDGSPWRVEWRRHDNGRSGTFTQTFIETLDNKVKTTTDEVGPYETDVQFPSNDKAVWTSPHQNVITVLVIDGGVKGAGRLGDLTLQYSSKR